MKTWISIILILCFTLPVFAETPSKRLWKLYDEEKYDEAMAIADSLIQAEGPNRQNMQAKYYLYNAMGEKEKALEAALKTEEVNEKKSPWDCMSIVEASLKLEKNEMALNWFGKAVDRGFKSLTSLEDSVFASFQNEDQFKALVAKIKENIGIDKPAKEISLQLLDGESFVLSEQKGKVVVVDFFATWCAPCRAEMPNLKKLYTEKKSEGLEIMGISLDSDQQKLTDYLAKEELPWLFSYSGDAWEDANAINYGVNSIPSIWVVDKQGALRYFDMRGEALDRVVTDLLAE